MFQKRSLFRRLSCALLCSILWSAGVRANTEAHCDSLLQSGVIAMQKGEYVNAIEWLSEVEHLAGSRHWYQQQFLAKNNLGLTYYQMFDYGEALNFYLEAYTIAVKHLTPQQEMIVLNNIAVLYSKEKNYDKAREYFLKAYDIAKKNKVYLKVGLYGVNLGIVANETGQLKAARAYLNEALLYLDETPQTELSARVMLAENLLLEGKTKAAFEAAQQLRGRIQAHNFRDLEVQLLVLLAKISVAEHNYTAAEGYAQQALAKADVEESAGIYEILADLSKQKKDFGTALLYKDSILLFRDSLNQIKNGRLYENNKVKFELQNYRHELVLNKAQLQNERRMFYWIISCTVVVLLFLVWTLRNLSARHKQKKMIEERSRQIMTLELEKEKNENLLLEKQFREKETTALLEQERLKNEIESKNRKLSAKALYLSGRNQLIEEILSELSALPELAKDVSLGKHIRSLKNHVKTDTEWDSFITHFEEVNQGFLASLKEKHPGLSANDMRFIAYIYMNLSTKEIASMLNITAEACRKRKERISRKMGLSEDLQLYDYLSAL
jgi:hypothetical protein